MSKGEYWDDYSEDSEYSRERRGDQSTTEGQQRKVERKDIRGVLLHSQRRRKKTSCKKHWKQR
jgi:hypothetical protein